MLSIREALELMLPGFAPLGPERVPLLQANGRVLFDDAFASLALPEFDNSAMDGYAVRHADLAAAGALPICAEIRAGGGVPAPLPGGHAARIFTGAPMPEHADTVVIQENARRREGQVEILEVPPPGANVRARGSDVRRGQQLLAAGALIGPPEIGLLAAQGQSELRVFRRPRVAILSTGDELRAIDAPAQPGTIVNSNAYSLAAAVEQAGCSAELLPIARDVQPDIAQRITDGLHADALITIGGVSVGDYDLVESAMREAGVDIAFHKVAIKPGKPLLYGRKGEVPVVGLPGNPVSALVTFLVFVRPCLGRMQGRSAPFDETCEVVLGAPCKHSPGRTEFVRARLTRQGADWVAQLHPRQGSGSLQSLVQQDVLVVLPAEAAHFPAGTRLRALRLAPQQRAEPPDFG
jgi:molybdopterin molybdotransferase